MNLKVDAKALELDGGNLYAAKIAIVGESDVSTWVPGPFKTVAQLRLEIGIPPELIEKVYQAKRAARAIERYGEADRRFREIQHDLGKRKTWIRRLESRAGEGLSKADAARLTKLREEVLVLEAQSTKLKGLRKTLTAAKNRGLQTLTRVGEKLEQSALGRLVSRIAGSVVGRVFKRLIPLYNIYQTAKDIYELAKGLASIDWTNESMGDTNTDGMSVEGKETPTDAEQNPDAKGGATHEDLPADLLDVSDLEPAEDKLSATAEQVVSAVRQPSGDAGDAAPLSPDEIGVINDIVPADLDAEEIARLQALVRGALKATGEPLSIPEAIVGAMQAIRPDGIKQQASLVPARAPASSPNAQQSAKPKKKVRKAKRKPKSLDNAGPVDIRAYLFDHVIFDATSRTLEYPTDVFQLGGVRLLITAVKVSFQMTAGEADLLPMAYVTVAVVDNQRGRRFVGQTRYETRASLLEVFEARVKARPGQSMSSAQRTP